VEAEQVQKTLVENRQEIEKDPTSPVMGNPDGDVTVVEFFDYRCPYCRRMTPLMQDILAQDSGVRWVFKEFPILGPESLYAARAALAAGMQGKYAAFHMALMANGVEVTKENVEKVAAGLGLDMEKLQADMQSEAVDQILAKNHALAGKLLITGTPAFIVGETLVPGAISLAQLRQLIEQQRDKNG
jgi:protein-disulfide isomerase